MGDSKFHSRDWRTSVEQNPWQVLRGLAVHNSHDLQRILALPRRDPVVEGSPTADAMIHIAMEKYSRGPRECACRDIDASRFEKGRDGCIKSFLWIQAWMLYEIQQANGLIGSIAAGAGKTLAFAIAPLALKNCRLALLVVPPTLLKQFYVDYRLFAEHFRVPGVVVHISEKNTPRQLPELKPSHLRVSDDPNDDRNYEPVLHVISYNGISSTKNSDFITNLKPDVIIFDEVDALASLESARTLRVLRSFAENEEMRFIGASGSLTSSSIEEMAHLSYLALRDNSPLPTERGTIEEWSHALDPTPNPCPVGELVQLLREGEDNSVSSVRRALGRRMAETPGFIMIGGRQRIELADGTEVSQDIRERKAPAIPQIIDIALKKVRRGERPDTLAGNEEDDSFETPLEQAVCARQVASGMFYRWIFPRGEPRYLIKEWYEARKLWHSELRDKKLRGESQLDSEKLCERAARRYWGQEAKHPKLPEWAAENWMRWLDIRDQVQPQPQAVRLDPYLIDDALDWGEEGPGIIWYTMREFSQWMQERARARGVDFPVFGEGSGQRLSECLQNGSLSGKTILASLDSHGRGRDRLQFLWDRQILAQVPSSSKRFSQLLARLHRRGQSAQQVVTELYQHTDELRKALAQATNQSEYVEDITSEETKLLIGLKHKRAA